MLSLPGQRSQTSMRKRHMLLIKHWSPTNALSWFSQRNLTWTRGCPPSSLRPNFRLKVVIKRSENHQKVLWSARTATQTKRIQLIHLKSQTVNWPPRALICKVTLHFWFRTRRSKAHSENDPWVWPPRTCSTPWQGTNPRLGPLSSALIFRMNHKWKPTRLWKTIRLCFRRRARANTFWTGLHPNIPAWGP